MEKTNKELFEQLEIVRSMMQGNEVKEEVRKAIKKLPKEFVETLAENLEKEKQHIHKLRKELFDRWRIINEIQFHIFGDE